MLFRDMSSFAGLLEVVRVTGCAAQLPSRVTRGAVQDYLRYCSGALEFLSRDA